MNQLTLFFIVFYFLFIAGCSKKDIPEPLPEQKQQSKYVERKIEAPESPKIILNAFDIGAIKGNTKKWALVRGKVYDVFEAKSGKVINLNLGPDYKTCFKVVIFQSAFEKWTEGKPYFKNLVAKQIAVEGSIAEYMGMPQIVVNSPTQLRMD